MVLCVGLLILGLQALQCESHLCIKNRAEHLTLFSTLGGVLDANDQPHGHTPSHELVAFINLK